MSDFDTTRDLPNNQDAYDNWYSDWIFGLPDGTLTSDECGAMPFRYGKSLNTVNAERCLRGEDWAFLQSVVNQTSQLPSIALWPNYNPSVFGMSKTISRAYVQGMYNFLAYTQGAGCFGEDFSLSSTTGVIVNSESDIQDAITTRIMNTMTIESSQPPQTCPLSLTQMRNFFKDTKKMQCTVADAGFTWSESPRTIYRYDSYPSSWGMPSTKSTSNITEISLGQVYGPLTQKIRLPARVLIGVKGVLNQGGTTTTKHALLAVGNTVEMTTSAEYKRRARATVNITGQHIAWLFGQVTGMPIEPEPVGDESSDITLQHTARYLIVYPKWLLNYITPDYS